jgi:hypothetical protein
LLFETLQAWIDGVAQGALDFVALLFMAAPGEKATHAARYFHCDRHHVGALFFGGVAK